MTHGERTVEMRVETGHAVLKRLILWVEKEAHLVGADIEVEVASILAKLNVKKS